MTQANVTAMYPARFCDRSYERRTVYAQRVSSIANRSDVNATSPCGRHPSSATVAHMEALALVVAWWGCGADFSARPCTADADCRAGSVCELRSGEPICVAAKDATIEIGHSGPASGPHQLLGAGMKAGITLAFEEQNQAGGIRGRELVLDFRDDAYDPIGAEAATREFTNAAISTDPPKCPSTAIPVSDGHGNTTPVSTTALTRGAGSVLALLGNVGSATMLRAAPVAVETGTIYFGAFTGADRMLRDNTAGECAKYIFNVRASFAQEAQATISLFKKRKVPGYRNLISFDQGDAFGDAGYAGLVAGYVLEYGKFPNGVDVDEPIVRFRYARSDENSVVDQAAAATRYLDDIAKGGSPDPVGIMMTTTYGAAATFIKLVREWQFNGQPPDGKRNLEIYFSSLSLVGANALADWLVGSGSVSTPNGPIPFTKDTYVSQVVPNYQSDSSEVVVAYNRRVATSGLAPTFTSLEGYISARIFIAGLLAHPGPFTSDGLISAFESLPDLSFGIGPNSGFRPTSHQYSNSVWGTSITPAGGFKNLYYWTSGSPIQLFE